MHLCIDTITSIVTMVDLHSLPAGSRPENAIRNNGPNDLALERYKLRELAEGWPAYRYVSMQQMFSVANRTATPANGKT